MRAAMPRALHATDSTLREFAVSPQVEPQLLCDGKVPQAMSANEEQLYTQEQFEFCNSLPKVELHAHLNGSIRDSTIR